MSHNAVSTLPPFVARLARRLPVAPLAPLVDAVLARTFTSALADGELDFLEGHELVIGIADAGMELGFSLRDGQLRCGTPRQRDVSITGPAAAFVLLASKRVDADTLFFQRTLVMSGDTELGLGVKYLLEAMPLDALPHMLRVAVEKLAARVQPDIPAVPRQ